MWGKPPFSIDDDYAVDVCDLMAAQRWYEEKLGLKKTQLTRQDDSGRPFVDLESGDSGTLTLVELSSGAHPQPQHVIFATGNLESTMAWMKQRGIAVEPITGDSGGNEFFYFLDRDGNRIEVGRK